MASEMQNSNPTILNSADLPTRLRPVVSHKPGAFKTSSVFATALPPDPIDLLSTSPPSSLDSESDGDLMEEPIDEQEIYGKYAAVRVLSKARCINSVPSILTDGT